MGQPLPGQWETESRSMGECVRRAIQLESSAKKLGNVHPEASFHDLTYAHFQLASETLGQAVDAFPHATVGQLVLEMTQQMMRAVQTNTSLGTILLLAPLIVAERQFFVAASVPLGLGPGTDGSAGAVSASGINGHPTEASILSRLGRSRCSIGVVLSQLDDKDSKQIYQAIQVAKAGGLGTRESMDVRGAAPGRIQDAMEVASKWDDVALQYGTDFELVFEIAQKLQTAKELGFQWLNGIRQVQLEVLSERVDSLIARKQGLQVARQVQAMAATVRSSGVYGSPEFEFEWERLDQQMRDEDHRGNPGTVADLIAAALFLLV